MLEALHAVVIAQPKEVILAGRAAATEILRTEGLKGNERILSFQEALAMSAVAHIISLDTEETFYARQVVKVAGLESGTVSPILFRFEDRYRLVTSELEQRQPTSRGRGAPRRMYLPTELGRTVFSLFPTAPS